MLARKGIVTTAPASSRYALRSGVGHQDQSAALSFRISRLFSSSKMALQTSEPARVPRPIPLDIGNGPSVSVLSQSINSTAAAATRSSAPLSSVGTAAAGGGGSTKRFRSYNSGSLFDRYGEPIINVIIYTTATSLALHLVYNHLSLEEYRISSSKKIADLETEIATIKGQPVQHSLGGRGEFI